MRISNTVLALLCWCNSILAQKPLDIGDAVPAIRFQNLVNHSAAAANLSDFKGKLVLIDFWATWCTSCLHAFGKLDSLQSVFGDELQIILVNTKSTRDDFSTVQEFFRKWEKRTGKKLSLPSVVNDTALDKLFPHQLIPHYVWISKEGKLLAITSSDVITPSNIRAAWEGKELLFTMKKDQDAGRPLFSTADLPTDKLLNYCVFFRGWFDGLPSGSRARIKEGIVCGKAITNTSLLDMYRAVARSIDSSIDDKRFLVITPDSSELFPPSLNEEREAWYGQHAHTLDMVLPVEEANHLYQKMLEVLNIYSGYRGTFQKRNINSWTLTKKDTDSIKPKQRKAINNLWSKEKPSLQYGSMETLVKRPNSLPAIKEPVLDSTGYTQTVDIYFTDAFNDLETIQKQLAKYGMELRLQEQIVTVFVLQKKSTD